MTIRLAIIGAGIMGADHARLFAEDIRAEGVSKGLCRPGT